MINLANNAVKFTEQGEITITVGMLERSASGVILRFAVQDTGIGMTPSQQRRLFRAFSQGPIRPRRANLAAPAWGCPSANGSSR